MYPYFRDGMCGYDGFTSDRYFLELLEGIGRGGGSIFSCLEFHQCRGSDTQYELQTLSTFQQCKTAAPVKVVCG